MRSFQFWAKATRWHFCVVAALGTWVTALLSNGPQWINPTKLSALLTMALCVAGASLYHYGAARDVYVRKSERWWVTRVPRGKVMRLGLGAFFTAIVLAVTYLNVACIAIVVFDAVAILLYAQYLGRHWLTKNLVITLVITSPVLLGWFAGHRTNAVVPWLLMAVGAGYLAREIIKDIDDIFANEGRRVTLPMTIGTTGAMRIAGICSAVSCCCLALAGRYLVRTHLTTSTVYMIVLGASIWVTVRLYRDHQPGRLQHWIFGASVLLILDMFLYRLQLGS